MSEWLVRHFNHSEIAHGEARPENLSYAAQLGKPGVIAYDLDLSHSLAVREFTDPYQTDWVLYNDAREIDGGMHTAINVNEAEGNVLQVAGMTWLHYFDKLEWPFNPAAPTQYLYQQAGRDIALIVKDILDTTLGQTYTLDVTYSLSSIGQTANYKIEPADTEKVLSKIEELSKLAPGFDYDISWDKVFTLYAPSKGAANSYVLELGANIQNMQFGDNGKLATHLRGFGSAQAGTRRGSVVQSTTFMEQYRRLTESVEFNTVGTQTDVDNKTVAEFDRQSANAIEFSCEIVDPNTDLWGGTLSIGDTYKVYMDLRYDIVDDDFRLVGIEVKPDDEGNEVITLTFDDGTLSL